MSRSDPGPQSDAPEHGAPRERSPDQPPMVKMAVAHYAPFRWVQAAIAFLGLWLMTAPLAVTYSSRALLWSDVASGAAALVLAAFALRPSRGLVSWLVSAVGLWLLLAPLVFWAPDPFVYASDTLVGALLIGFGLVIPMGMTMKGPAVPPGWSYNPSAWSQRAPVIGLGLVSFLVARAMAGFQLGHIDSIPDPLFGDGARRVLESEVSRAWPISDAGLGAVTYLIEVLMGLMGDPRRWRTMPWMVAGFGFVVVPLGIVSIALVIMQPVAVGEWCSPCLFTAIAMLVMIPLSLDEITAMVQFVARRRRRGHSAWRTFWLGGELGGDHDEEPPARTPTWRPAGMVWGMGIPWTLALSTALGVGLMASPALFGISIKAAAADSAHIAGALVVVVAVIAMAEVARPARLLNVALGGWLIAAPWFLAGGTPGWRLSSALAGLLIVALAVPRGAIRERYGRYDRAARWPSFGGRREARPGHG